MARYICLASATAGLLLIASNLFAAESPLMTGEGGGASSRETCLDLPTLSAQLPVCSGR